MAQVLSVVVSSSIKLLSSLLGILLLQKLRGTSAFRGLTTSCIGPSCDPRMLLTLTSLLLLPIPRSSGFSPHLLPLNYSLCFLSLLFQLSKTSITNSLCSVPLVEPCSVVSAFLTGFGLIKYTELSVLSNQSSISKAIGLYT